VSAAQRTHAVTHADIAAAAARIAPHVLRTPVIPAHAVSGLAGRAVSFKCESMQRTGSFKIRGATNAVRSIADRDAPRGVVTHSSGNHALALATAAAERGMPAHVVMPANASPTKRAAVERAGAAVITSGNSGAEREAAAAEVQARTGATMVPPFDHPWVIAGQGTIALEMLADNPDLDTLVVPIGGGGLISGIAVAAKALKPDIKIIGVEAAMYPCMHAALRGKTPKMGGATIAEGIAVKEVGKLTRQIAERLLDDILLVEEEHLERAITLFAEVEKTIAEGAGAAGLAALLAHPSRFYGRKVGLVLCGGNIDTRLLASVLTRALVRENRLARIRIIGDDRPGLLALVSKIIGDNGANIMEVAHNRIALDVPAKGAEFDILMETRDSQHTQEVIDALAQAGYPPRAL